MAIDLGKAIRNSFTFALNRENYLAMFAYSFLFGALFLGFLAIGGLNLESVTLQNILPALEKSVIPVALLFLAAFAIGLYLPITFTISYATKASLKKSWQAIKLKLAGKYLLALILVGLISSIAGKIPLIGFILSILAGLAFYFVEQEVILKKSGVIDSLKYSYNLFIKNGIDIFAASLVGGIISLCIVVIFAIPLLNAMWPFIGSLLEFIIEVNTAGSGSELSTIPLPSFPPINVFDLIIPGFISLLGSTLAVLFVIAYKTDVYLQLTKGMKKKK
jgi:hypothetical protein